MSQVIPISMTQVDWPSYLRFCIDTTGRSISRDLDAANVELKGPFAFIASLSSFKGDSIHPNNAVRGAGFLLRHFSFGFLVTCTESCRADIQSVSELSIDQGYHKDIGGEQLYLMSGTLFQWRSTIIENLSKPNCNSEIREVLNKVILLLEQAGLVDLFSTFKKRAQRDDTFILER
jgi:hypothetical protein